MPLIKYIDRKFSEETLQTIALARQIITQYEGYGMTLTLRQLYYQMVSRDVIANTMREYQRLSTVISNARLAGLIDWDSLEDRTRFTRQNSHWSSPADIVRICAAQYARDKWAEQPYHVEVLIEKDALVGVIENVCKSLDVTFASCRGYMSQSTMWETAMRLKAHARAGKQLLVVHLGDHDPSGKHMSVDITERLELFLGTYAETLEVNRIALNYDQIEQYNPPPNPAKFSDPRAAAYVAEFGESSWELDALNPLVIAELIRDAVTDVRDSALWEEAEEQERVEKKQLQLVSDNFDRVCDAIDDWETSAENSTDDDD
jgi:hypothetical protein